MAYTEEQLDDIRNRRLFAAIEMAKEAYQVDGYGLGEMLGMTKTAWTKSTKHRDWRKATCKVYFGLYDLTGYAEELEGGLS